MYFLTAKPMESPKKVNADTGRGNNGTRRDKSCLGIKCITTTLGAISEDPDGVTHSLENRIE